MESLRARISVLVLLFELFKSLPLHTFSKYDKVSCIPNGQLFFSLLKKSVSLFKITFINLLSVFKIIHDHYEKVKKHRTEPRRK